MKTSLLIFPLVFLFAFTPSEAQNSEPRLFYSGRTNTADRTRDGEQFWLRQADLHWRNMDIEEAFFALENAIADDAQNVHALLRRANYHQALGNQAEAAADLRRARMNNPHAADLYDHDRSGHLTNILAHRPEASVLDLTDEHRLQYYRRLFETAYDGEQVDHYHTELIAEATENVFTGDPENALELLEEIVEAGGASALVYDLYGLIAYQGEDYETAHRNFSRALELRPDFELAWYNLARAETKLGNAPAARAAYDRAIEISPDMAKAYFGRALLRKRGGDLKGATADYDRVIELRGLDYVEATLNRGLTKSASGDYQGALDDLNSAIERYPERAELYKNRGNLNLMFGKHVYALHDYNRALELDPNYAEAYHNRGLTHFLLFEPISACYDLRRGEELGYAPSTEQMRWFCSE